MSRELSPALGALWVVEREHAVGLRARLAQVAEEESRDHGGGGTEDLQIDVLGLTTLVQQALSPWQRVGDASLGDRGRPHPPQPEQQTLDVALAPGQPENRRRVHTDLLSRPSLQAGPGRVELLTYRELNLVAFRRGRQLIGQSQGSLQMGHRLPHGYSSDPDRKSTR